MDKQNYNKDNYTKETANVRNTNRESHFGNNLRLLQTIYENSHDTDNLSQEKWAELTGLSRTNFRFWSTNRDTIPHYEKVKKIVQFFNHNLNLPIKNLTPSMLINKNLTRYLSPAPLISKKDIHNRKNEIIFNIAWDHLTLRKKIELFQQANQNIGEGESNPKQLISKGFCRRYIDDFQPHNIKNLIRKRPGFFYEANNDYVIRGSNNLIINTGNKIVFHISAEKLQVYKINNIKYNELILGSLNNTEYDTGTIKEIGHLKLFRFNQDFYAAVVNIVIVNNKDFKHPHIIYDVKDGAYKQVESIDWFCNLINEIANILINNLHTEIL